MNKTYILTLSLLFLCVGISNAQKVKKPIKSGNLIEKGVKLHDKGDYEGAIEQYLKIPKNDTNYVLMLTELSMTYLEDEQYEKCIKVAREGISYDNEYGANLYVNLGTALDESGDKEAAIEAYSEGLAKFKKNYLLYYNKGITFEKLERDQEAVECYKNALMINPVHATSHLRLGFVAANERKYTQCLLSFNAFLMLEPVSQRALEVIDLMNLIAVQDLDSVPKGVVFSETGDDFSKVEGILKSRVAQTDKTYSPKMKVVEPMTRQNMALLKNIEYNENDEGWWMQMYAKFFQRVWDNGYAVEMSWLEMAALRERNSKIAKAFSKVSNDVTKYQDWCLAAMQEDWAKRSIDFNGERQKVTHWQMRGGMLDAIGEKDDSQRRLGYWEFYYVNGILSAKGAYDNGEKTGPWKYYHYNGKLKDEASYDDGEPVGAYASYNKYGVMVQEGTYVDGELDGIVKEYHNTGGLFRTSEYKDGKLDGLMTVFFKNGAKRYEIPYDDGEVNGMMQQWHDNGVMSVEAEFKGDEKDGWYKEFFRNGQMSSQAEYEDDEAEGGWEAYYMNGQLRRTGKTKGNSAVGEWKSYFEDGTLMNVTIYDDEGKLNGGLKDYDRDGKLHYEMIYDKGDVSSYKYYAKDGSVIHEAEKEGKELDFVGYWPHGIKKVEGKYINGKKHGVWKYYDHNGVMSTEEVYKKDKLHGIIKEYYPNGKLESEVKYRSDDADGPNTAWHYNGELKREGWSDDDEWIGDWYFYRTDGTMSSHRYYVNSELLGFQNYYSVAGLLEETKEYRYDNLIGSVFYDSTGKELESVVLENATGEFKNHYPNGKPFFTGYYKDGAANGKYTWRYPNGQALTIGEYTNDERDKAWTWYYEDGSVDTKGFYDDGDRDSLWLGYYENGKKAQQREYKYGKSHGTWKYWYDNGQLELERTYYYGDSHGKVSYYSPDGKLQYVRFYDYGRLIGYSYNGSDGKLKEMIPIEKETVKMVAYFSNGKKSTEWERVNGWLEGPYTKYYSSGQVHEEYTYESNDVNGPKKVYYKDGKIKSDEVFLMDNKHGLCKYYYSNGKLKSEINYLHDTKHGEAKFYNTSGKLTKTVYYYDGKPIDTKTP